MLAARKRSLATPETMTNSAIRMNIGMVMISYEFAVLSGAVFRMPPSTVIPPNR
jgi:hypothetical protein